VIVRFVDVGVIVEHHCLTIFSYLLDIRLYM